MGSGDPPDGPDPGKEGARFLAWVKKRGSMVRFKDCHKKHLQSGFDAHSFVRSLGSPFIEKYAWRGEAVLKLEDLPWAARWMIWYGEEVPHHRHWQQLKK
jgi:hypothetical protein